MRGVVAATVILLAASTVSAQTLVDELHKAERTPEAVFQSTIAHMIQAACRFEVIKAADLQLIARAVFQKYPRSYDLGIARARSYLVSAGFTNGTGDCRVGRKSVDNMASTLRMTTESLKLEGFR